VTGVNSSVALRSTQTLRRPRNSVQFDWQCPLMRNSSPLELARSISGWKSLYHPPLPNLSEVAANGCGRNQDEYKNSESSHGQPARFIMDERK
jgi:hypothetical protein